MYGKYSQKHAKHEDALSKYPDFEKALQDNSISLMNILKRENTRMENYISKDT